MFYLLSIFKNIAGYKYILSLHIISCINYIIMYISSEHIYVFMLCTHLIYIYSNLINCIHVCMYVCLYVYMCVFFVKFKYACI